MILVLWLLLLMMMVMMRPSMFVSLGWASEFGRIKLLGAVVEYGGVCSPEFLGSSPN